MSVAVRWGVALLLLLLAFAATSQAQSLLDAIAESPDHATLGDMLKSCGLDATLQGPKLHTVLAPTDMAFKRMDRDILNNALVDNQTMFWIMSYHIIPDVIITEAIKNGSQVKTLSGSSVRMHIDEDDKLKINEIATVTLQDLMANNGVLQVIDEVLLPWDAEDGYGSIAFRDAGMSGGDDEDMEGSGDTYDSDMEGSGDTYDSDMEGSGDSEDDDDDMDEKYPDEEDDSSEKGGGGKMNLVDLAMDERLNTLLFLAENTGILEKLKAPGPFTLLAPHDEAGFSLLDSSVMDRAMTDPDFLAQLLSYHIIPGVAIRSSDIIEETTYTTLQGEPITFSWCQCGDLDINGGNATVIYKDLVASNGVLHVIDMVLVPESLAVKAGSLLEVAADKKLTTLVEYMAQANLTDHLSTDGNYTLFAPTDEAFEKLSPETLHMIKLNPWYLKEMLLHHVTPLKLSTQQISNNLRLQSLRGESLRLNIYPLIHNMGIVTVNGARIIRMDIPASNGALYIIDTVLQPPEGTIARLLPLQDDLTTFTSLLESVDMMELLSQMGPFTVMAPVDAAFEEVPPEALDMLKADKKLLKKVLMNHVLPMSLFEAGMNTGTVPTLGDGPITFGRDSSSEVMMASMMTLTNLKEADLIATNGVLHKIGNILFS